MEHYLELWRQAAALGRGNLAAANLLLDPRTLREMWLTHLTQTTDRFLRSPEFLDLLRLSLRTVGGAPRPGPTP